MTEHSSTEDLPTQRPLTVVAVPDQRMTMTFAVLEGEHDGGTVDVSTGGRRITLSYRKGDTHVRESVDLYLLVAVWLGDVTGVPVDPAEIPTGSDPYVAAFLRGMV